MTMVLAYCNAAGMRMDLERGFEEFSGDCAILGDSGVFIDRALEERPAVLVLCFDRRDHWAEAGIAALKKGCGDSKIIFATTKPGSCDASSVERGIFYYAGNASSGEILTAIKAALKDKIRHD